MNAAVLAGIVFVFFALGYRFYSSFLARRVFALSPDEPVPSRECEDGVDYVPTRLGVLWGHHFASIAGAAPIVGPAIAVIWGWLPALIWVGVGTVFMEPEKIVGVAAQVDSWLMSLHEVIAPHREKLGTLLHALLADAVRFTRKQTKEYCATVDNNLVTSTLNILHTFWTPFIPIDGAYEGLPVGRGDGPPDGAGEELEPPPQAVVSKASRASRAIPAYRFTGIFIRALRWPAWMPVRCY